MPNTATLVRRFNALMAQRRDAGIPGTFVIRKWLGAGERHGTYFLTRGTKTVRTHLSHEDIVQMLRKLEKG